MIQKFICWIPLFFIFTGCASKPTSHVKPKSYVILLENEAGGTGVITVSNVSGSRVIDKKGYGVNLYSATSPPSEPAKFSEDKIKAEFEKTLEAKPDPPSIFTLYFLSGKNILTPESQQKINDILLEIKRREVPKIGIVGHSDRKGDDEYNYKLALSRAESVRKFILKSGVKSEDIVDVTSHGENNPIIQTEDGVSEPKNRRVEVIVR